MNTVLVIKTHFKDGTESVSKSKKEIVVTDPEERKAIMRRLAQKVRRSIAERKPRKSGVEMAADQFKQELKRAATFVNAMQPVMKNSDGSVSRGSISEAPVSAADIQGVPGEGGLDRLLWENQRSLLPLLPHSMLALSTGTCNKPPLTRFFPQCWNGLTSFDNNPVLPSPCCKRS